MKQAFTLAEVLITLGIIGVVAVLTLPALISSYQKNVLVTRLKKANSVFAQASSLAQETGTYDDSMVTQAQNPGMLEEFFNVSLAPHMKTLFVKKLTKGIVVGFPDGSAYYLTNLRIDDPSVPLQHARNYFCPDVKDCLNLDDSLFTSNGVQLLAAANPRTRLISNGIGVNGCSTDDIAFAASRCKDGSVYCCINYIRMNSWEIAPDYPW
jgi:prepilin-type N-terminal cleavage/methylation domain-containing protein